MRIELENSFKKALEDGMNLFLGSGFSLLASDGKGRALPTGSGLLRELLLEFHLPAADGLNLSQVCTILESTRRHDLYEFLTKRFTVATFDPQYRRV
jgi:hypothetical protein